MPTLLISMNRGPFAITTFEGDSSIVKIFLSISQDINDAMTIRHIANTIAFLYNLDL